MDAVAHNDTAVDRRLILVTGATGYVGGRLVPLLVAEGYRVRACARNPQRLKNRPWHGHTNLEIVAMILGSGSASFEMLRYLVDRLPVMITPRWVSTPCQPIAIKDVLGYLIGCLESPGTIGETFDIGGPDVLSYRDLIHTYADMAGLMPRIIFPVPVLTPRLSSLWIHLVTPVPSVIARPLAEGLSIPVICRDKRIRAMVPLSLQRAEETLRIALDRHPQAEEDACNLPTDTLLPPEWTACGDADYAGGTTLTMGFRILVEANIETVWRTVEAIGGAQGYYGNHLLWRARGALDAFIGGPGLKKRRRHASHLDADEHFHFWRVSLVDRPRRLVLESRMKAPGGALMGFQLTSRPDHTELVLQSVFLPRGLFGLGYWYGLYPAHQWVFRDMLKGIARQSGSRVIRGPEMIPVAH